MDVPACRRANRLVGNVAGAAVLEATIAGPVLMATAELLVAVTGGAFDVTIGGRAVPQDVAQSVAAGESIAIGTRRRGARAYLAVAGGIAVPPVLGSRSTTPGVLGGRALQTGDVLPIGPRVHVVTAHASVVVPPAGTAAPVTVPDVPGAQAVRVLPGPDAARLQEALAALCATAWTMGVASNRMACSLDGPPVPMPVLSVPSAATVMGMVQVPPDGRPLVLMADRQTTGGYPVPAVVIAADLWRVAQLAPGDVCRFAVCDRAEAVGASLALEREWLRK